MRHRIDGAVAGVNQKLQNDVKISRLSVGLGWLGWVEVLKGHSMAGNFCFALLKKKLKVI